MGPVSRRDFLFLASSIAGAIAVGASTWPFVAQMLPDQKRKNASTVDVNLEPITEGMAITVKWQGKPVVIRHRTPEEIKAAQQVTLQALKDPYARNANLEASAYAYDDARSAGKGREKWIIVVNICTHLGCIPTVKAGSYKGWFCPCHGSDYDTAGRIRSGPADKNLFIPPYQFLTDNVVRIG